MSSQLKNGQTRFASKSGDRPEVITNYLPSGENIDYTPLEMFLISLMTCAGGTVAPLLKKFGKTVANLKIDLNAVRKEVHPTSFESNHLSFHLVSPDATENDLVKAIQLSEEKYCPVWAMIKNNVEVTFDYTVSIE